MLTSALGLPRKEDVDHKNDNIQRKGKLKKKDGTFN